MKNETEKQVDLEKAYQALIKEGHKVLLREYECPLGKIDFVTKKGGELVFVSVRKKIDKAFEKTADYYMKRYGIKDVRSRFLEFWKDGRSPEVRVVDIRLVAGESNLKAFVDLMVGEAFLIKGWSVVNGSGGVFVCPPRKAGKDGRWFDIVTLVGDEMFNFVRDLILEKYEEELEDVKQ